MGILEEFAAWLGQWFKKEEVEAMLAKPWNVSEGAGSMSIEEFLHLAASFTVERVLHKRGVECVADHNRVYAFDIETRTVVVAATFKNQTVEPVSLEAFLRELEGQAEEAKSYMAVRLLAA